MENGTSLINSIRSFPIALILVAVVVGMIVLAGMSYLFLSRSKCPNEFDICQSQRILETGTVAKAKILGLRDMGGRLNGNPSIEFQLEVQPIHGPNFRASTQAIISVVDLPRYQPGALINVKFDNSETDDNKNVVIVQ